MTYTADHTARLDGEILTTAFFPKENVLEIDLRLNGTNLINRSIYEVSAGDTIHLTESEYSLHSDGTQTLEQRHRFLAVH